MAKGKNQKLSAEELLEQALVPEEEQPYEVPENWVWIKLEPLIDTLSGYPFDSEMFSSKPSDGFPLIRIRDVVRGYTETYTSQECSEIYHVKTGDILIGMDGDFNIATWKSGVSYLNQRVCKIKSANNRVLLDKYMLYYLPRPLKEIQDTTSSVTVKHLSVKKIQAIAFPLPPICEQQRIVDRIENLFTRLDQVKEIAQNALDSFETRKAAILHKAFTGELTAKWREEHGVGMNSWERKPIKEYVSKLNQGWSPKCEAHPSISEDMWAVIKTTAIQHMHFNEMENKQLPTNLEPKKQHELQEGDILITRAGPRIRVGVCCLVKNVRPRLLLCDKAYRFNALGDKTIPEFLVYQLNSPSILDEINRMKTGISESGVNLTQEGFLSIEIVMPSLPEQKEIVRLLDGFLEREQRVNELINIIDKIDNMKKAILARSFRGELGTNNPSEESALELLKEVAQ